MTGFMEFPFVEVDYWRKASVMLRPRLAPILFSRQVQPAYICLPSKNGQGGRSCTCDLLVPNPDASGLLTLHPENGCQTWTRTKTNGLTDRRATLTPPGNGAADRTSTCIVPFRRRMPRVFGHGSNLKLVSAAGFAPAVTRSQAGHVAATPRAGRPGDPKDTGDSLHGEGGTHTMNLTPAVRSGNWRTRRELHPPPSRRS